MNRRFLVCIHDATPAFAREIRTIVGDLAPLIGRRVAFGVVPNWHGEWPLASHRDFSQFIHDSAGEILLHGYSHRRDRGFGPASLLADRCDEMNGLDVQATRQNLERGQDDLIAAFGERARGFLSPAWQKGHVREALGSASGFDYVLGFFSLESVFGQPVPLATSTWDCGRWGWLGHLGHGIGWLLQSVDHGTPVLAIHPADLERGFLPKILRLTEELLDNGYEPALPANLIMNLNAEVAV